MCVEKSFDIICINETWLDSSVSDDEIDLDGYSLYRKDRNRHGGGVAVFVCDKIGMKNRIDIETFDTETLILEVMLNSKSFFFDLICPPGFSSQKIEDYLGKFQNWTLFLEIIANLSLFWGILMIGALTGMMTIQEVNSNHLLKT